VKGDVLAATLDCHGSPEVLILAHIRLQSPRPPHRFLFQQADGSFATQHGESARDQTLSVALGRVGASARMRVQDLEGNRLFGDKSALRFSARPEPGYCQATSCLSAIGVPVKRLPQVLELLDNCVRQSAHGFLSNTCPERV
jgi:hypothetical protein